MQGGTGANQHRKEQTGKKCQSANPEPDPIFGGGQNDTDLYPKNRKK